MSQYRSKARKFGKLAARRRRRFAPMGSGTLHDVSSSSDSDDDPPEEEGQGREDGASEHSSSGRRTGKREQRRRRSGAASDLPRATPTGLEVARDIASVWKRATNTTLAFLMANGPKNRELDAIPSIYRRVMLHFLDLAEEALEEVTPSLSFSF